MMEECRKLIEDYINWLKQKITIEKIEDVCEITTPFLDRHNDHIQIYLKKYNNRIILTDDGYTIRDLKISGVDFSTEKRRQILETILNGFGVKLKGDELFVEATPENFPQKKHNFIQAILSVNDLFVTAKPYVVSIFKEEVEKYLKANKIRFTPAVKFTGKSGFDHFFDFVIPSSDGKPERILRAINRPDRSNIVSMIFAWTDVKEIRPVKSSAYAVLNDTEKDVKSELIDALNQYEIRPVLWSKRDKYIKEFIE